jgi:hypothetical protein
MTTPWAPEQAKATIDGEGDILVPLKRVALKYLMRAAKHEASGRITQAIYYHEQAENVDRLINQ